MSFTKVLLLLLLCAYSYAELQVIVVGPSRSGTSFLGSVIEKLGFNGGKVRQPPNVQKIISIKGTHENIALMNLENKFLLSMGSTVNHPPDEYRISEQAVDKLCADAKQIIDEQNVEFYKSNRIPIIADPWNSCFPSVKWIWIERDFNERFESRNRFLKGRNSRYAKKTKNPIYDREYNVFLEGHRKVLAAWNSSEPSKKALSLKFEQFNDQESRDSTYKQIAKFLNVPLSTQLLYELHSMYRPVTTDNAQYRFRTMNVD